MPDHGEKLPIVRIPTGISFKPGDESVYAGKGDFYTLRYGPYVIGMNMSSEKFFELKAPQDSAGTMRTLVDRRPVSSGENVAVKPRTTKILYNSGPSAQ